MRIAALPILCLALLLSACTATSTPPPKVTVSSEAFSSVPLNARRLEIIENWQMPIEAPYIGHLQHPLPSSTISKPVNSHIARKNLCAVLWSFIARQNSNVPFGPSTSARFVFKGCVKGSRLDPNMT